MLHACWGFSEMKLSPVRKRTNMYVNSQKKQKLPHIHFYFYLTIRRV